MASGRIRPPRTNRALAPVVGVLLFAGITLLAACGSGVDEGRGESPSTTHGLGADTVLAPPTSTGPAAVPAGQDPGTLLGGDPVLDAMAGACFDADLYACDTLFFRSEVDSDLEAYGRTCGGRVTAEQGAPGCAVRFDAPPPDAEAPGDLGDDPVLDALADACFTGDFAGCDDLFLQSSPDSAYETYGSTCAGRLQLGAAGGCQSQLTEP